MKKQQIILGALPGVEECWLVLRGMKTMEIRMNKSSETALKIAEYLQRHPKIQKVYYPGLKNHEGYEINKKQSSGGGAVLSFDLGCCEKVRKFFKLVKYPIVAVSLGGVESILSYPYKMSHACVPEEERITLKFFSASSYCLSINSNWLLALRVLNSMIVSCSVFLA